MPSTATPAIDLDALLQRCLGNLDLAERAIEAFLSDLPGNLSELGEAQSAGDQDAIAQVAHRMKGAARNVGAEGLAEMLQALEDTSDDAADNDRARLVEEVRVEVQRLEAAML